METKEKQRNGELGVGLKLRNEDFGSAIIKIKENPELSEQQKNEKITEILIEAADYVDRKGLRDLFFHIYLHDLFDDYLQLSRVTGLTDYLPEKEKAKVLKEVVNVSMNLLKRYYKFLDSHFLVEAAVDAAQRIQGEEGIEILEKLGNEFLSRNWTWSASLVADALARKGEKEKAKEIRRKIDFREVAFKGKWVPQPYPPSPEDYLP